MDDIQKPDQSSSEKSSKANQHVSKVVANNFKPTWASKILVFSLILVSIAVTASLASVAFLTVGSDSEVNSNEYQAVFLQDGQVYIGHLSGLNDDYVRLDDVFYVLPPQNLQAEETVGADGQTQQQASNQPVLAKRGKEIHAPSGTIFIDNDKVLFWENMSNEGEVAKTIVKYYELEASGQLNNTDQTQPE